MIYEASLWLLFNLIAIAVSAYFSMMEMACVSFNKVRLQYYLSKGIKQAEWLNALLRKPARLFGTTLIGVNAANIISSECAREMYASIGLSPDLSPITQVALVVIFGELAPMFAARHYPEHVVMLGVRLLYASSVAMKPLLWLISGISYACNWFIGGSKNDGAYYLTQEELLSILEEPEKGARSDSDEYNRIAYNIFQLRHLKTGEIMKPITEFPLLDGKSTIEDMRNILKHRRCQFFPIYHRTISQIVGIVFPRDALRGNSNHRVRDYSITPWFITRNTSCMEILQQFRNNNQTVAVVIDNKGEAVGIVTLDMLFEELIAFGEEDDDAPEEISSKVLMNRTVSAQMRVGEFEKKFQVELDDNKEWTLEELMQAHSDHALEQGDVVVIEPYLLTVKETTLTEIKTVTVSTQL